MAEVDPRFADLSALLTGYDEASLWGTGCMEDYWRQLRLVTPDELREDLLAAGAALAASFRKDPESGARMVRETLLSDGDFGPLCRSLMQLWYLGAWTPLPQDWVRRNGLRDADRANILSKRSYLEGLAWDAIGAHPMGGKQQGFGAWALPPSTGSGD